MATVTVTVGKPALQLTLTYDLDNNTSDEMTFTRSTATSPCVFKVSNLTIINQEIDWLKQTIYRLRATHTTSNTQPLEEEFMLIILSDIWGNIISAISSFKRSPADFAALNAMAGIRCCPRSTAVLQ